MATTYEPIATYTATSAVSIVTFSSIPSTYTDLIIVGNYGMSAAAYPYLRFNSDTATNYSTTDIYGTGTSALSSREASGSKIFISLDIPGSTSILDNFISNIQNYANATTYKTALTRMNNAAQGTTATVGIWRNTAAITTVVIQNISAGINYNFVTGSTFTLYGIKSA